MSDEIIKKLKIPNASLPPLNAETLNYNARYRVISEDKKLFSHWSSIFDIDPNYTFVSGTITITSSTSTVTTIWDKVVYKIGTKTIKTEGQYDIWIKWYKNSIDGDWIYHGREATDQLVLTKPSTFFLNGVNQTQTPNRFAIEIFLPGHPITRTLTGLRMYNPAEHTI